jgi:hypothetical protein
MRDGPDWEILMEAKRSISLISQVLTRKHASTLSLRHTKAVAMIAINGANHVRVLQGKIRAPPAGFRRDPSTPRLLPGVAREQGRVLPAPLRTSPDHVLTGVTAATLRIHATRHPPTIQRTDYEMQATLREAYGAGL